MIRIIDSSVFIKWFIAEQGHEAAFAWLDDETTFMAPGLLVCEIANIAWKKLRRGDIDADDGYRIVFRCAGGRIGLIPDETLALTAWQISRDLDHPVYDCFFLAAAEVANAPLLTADKRLCAAVANTEYAPYVRDVVAS